jgi:hypothetical protein
MMFDGDTADAYLFKGNSTYSSYGGANSFNIYNEGPLAFHSSTTSNIMFMTAGGNVGIGTTSPFAIASTNLSVNGASSAIQLGVSDVRTAQFYADTAEVRLYAVANFPLKFGTNDTERMRITCTGDLWFTGRSTTANYQSVFYNDNSQFAINATNTSTGKTINFNPSNTLTAMAITSTGIVCIGSTASTTYGTLNIVQQSVCSPSFVRGIELVHPNGTGATGGYIGISMTGQKQGTIQVGDDSAVGNLLLQSQGGNVGISTATIPSDHVLQIHSNCSYGRMALTNTCTGVASGDGLIFQIENCFAIIKNQETNCLVLGTNGRETDIVINQNGPVGVGASALNKFTVFTSADNALDIFDTGASFGLGMQAVNTTNTVYKSWDFYATKFNFYNGQAIFSPQVCALSGVKFGNGSGTLNYYEQGTWTPRLKNGSFTTNAGVSNVGWYTRIGNLITVGGTLDWGAGTGAPDGNSLQIACLPFASSNTGNERNVGQFGAPAANSIGFKCTTKGQVVLVNDPGASYIYLIETFQNGTYLTYIHDLCVANAGTLYGFQITYHI